jgi:O-antigen/teichoic acid export membrane protein
MPTVPYFKILSLTGLMLPLSMIAYNVLKVAGDGRVIVRIEVVAKVIMTAILALTIPHSVMAVAWGLAVMSAVEFLLNMAIATPLSGLKFSSVVRTLLPIELLTVVMYMAVITTSHFATQLALWLRFTLQIAVGVITYLGVAVVLKMEFMRQVVQILKGAISRGNS